MEAFYDWFMQYDATERGMWVIACILYGYIIVRIFAQGIKKGRSHGPFRDHK